MTPEGKVKHDITKWLDQLKKDGLPIFYDVRQAGGFNYKKGIPDIYVVFNGHHIEIEVKKPGGQQSVMQEKFQAFCEMIHVDYLLIDSINDFRQKFTSLMENFF